MKKFAKSMMIAGVIFELVSLVLAFLSVVNWRKVSRLWYYYDFSSGEIRITIPYLNILLYIFESALFMVLLSIIKKQIHVGKKVFLPEIFALIYGIGVHPLIVHICTITHQMICGKNVPALNPNPELYQLTVMANQSITNCINAINHITMFMGVTLALVGCSASLVGKYNGLYDGET